MRRAALLSTLLAWCACGSRSVAPAPSPAPIPAGPAARDTLAGLDAACAGGDARSCTAVGRAHDQGIGTTADDVRAAEFYRRGCDGGDPTGCNDLGALLRDGNGVTRDEAGARRLFEQACHGGHLTGCANLGAMLRDGRGGAPDQAAAATLLAQACDGGNGLACSELGQAERACELDPAYCRIVGWKLEHGEGAAHDVQRAAELYDKACTAEDLTACNDLATLLQNGKGVGKDMPRAAALYEKGCYGGVLLACRNLGWLHESGSIDHASLPTAARLYDKACAGGDAAGCSYLGDLYEKEKGVPKDEKLAARYYKLGCRHGHMWGCNALAWLYESGRGVPQDWLEAIELHEQACAGEHWRACSNLGYMYEKGQGVAIDRAEAHKWYDMACDHDDGQGCFNLGNLSYDGLNGEIDEQESARLYEKACNLDDATGCASLGFLYEHGYGVRIDEQQAELWYRRACNVDTGQCDHQPVAARVPPDGWRWDAVQGTCAAPFSGDRMIKVPAGRFVMGSRPGEGDDEEHPTHTVDLSAYSIGKTEVAVCQYAECVKAGKCTPPIAERSWWGTAAMAPIVGVTWDQASAYCAWKGWRLPSEAEWERAARGTDGRRYPWGDEDPTCDRADWDPNGEDTYPDACGGDGPSLVGSLPAGASAIGALDMSGNAREWTADWFGPYATLGEDQKDPTGPEHGTSRVVRGGGWASTEGMWISTTVRYRFGPMNASQTVGFRCAAGGPKPGR